MKLNELLGNINKKGNISKIVKKSKKHLNKDMKIDNKILTKHFP